MKNRTLSLLLALLPLIFAACGPKKAAPTGDRAPLLLEKPLSAVTSDLEETIPGLMKRARIPGLQVALVRDGRVVWQRSFGVKNAKTGAPVTDETIFEAASLTKPFFAYAVMKMVDEGLIDLDRPFHAYFTREEIEKGLGHSLDAPGFRRDWFEKITTRQILSHSGGLPHGESREVLPLYFEPGTKWKYSATGYEYLQVAIEKLKGRKLDAVMQDYVFGPLGMVRSGMVWRPAYEGTMANGHGLFEAPQDFRKRTEAISSASLYTTAAEYARFVCAVLSGEGLKPETAREMLASVIDLKEDKSLGWSLGFGLQNDGNGAALWQWGDYGIFRNFVIAYPARKTAVVYLTNSFNGLSICPDVVARSVGGQALGNSYLNYRHYDSAFYELFWGAKEGGPKKVRRLLPRLRKRDPVDLNWETLGAMAGLLSDEGLPAEAVTIQEYVVRENPASGRGAFDLARSYAILGDLNRARVSYEKAGQADRDKIDPKNIRWDLDYLQAAEKPILLEGSYARTLAGDYESRHVSIKDGQLLYSREGSPATGPRPLLAFSKDTFFIKGRIDFRLQFALDEAGRPVKLIGLYDDGRRDESKRTK